MKVQDLTKLVEMRDAADRLSMHLDELIKLFASGAGESFATIPQLKLDRTLSLVKADCAKLVESGDPIFHVLVGGHVP